MNDLDQLDHVAAAADEGAALADNPAAAQEAEALAAGPDYHGQAVAGLDLFCGMVAGYAPETAEIFDTATKGRIAAAAVPVMEKYGFTFEKVPPELILIAVAGPPVYQAARMVATRMERDKAPKDTAPKQPQGIERAAAATLDKPEPTPRHPQEALYK
ncbi:hypothetical protein [Simplicispira suum]|uniref:Uncharacterized protein n=1 Tax=Simplicispira suum TaxID=2109915 RepID=A0A2S0N3K6_9BURK|nr:hypothetical protein [Simplicispira suum]AVO42734.1 hypothetical protein C6571_16815 [Simplicispira suum]